MPSVPLSHRSPTHRLCRRCPPGEDQDVRWEAHLGQPRPVSGERAPGHDQEPGRPRPQAVRGDSPARHEVHRGGPSFVGGSQTITGPAGSATVDPLCDKDCFFFVQENSSMYFYFESMHGTHIITSILQLCFAISIALLYRG